LSSSLLLEAWRLLLETFFWSSIDEAQPQLFMGIPGPIYLTPGPSLHADATVSAMDQGSSNAPAKKRFSADCPAGDFRAVIIKAHTPGAKRSSHVPVHIYTCVRFNSVELKCWTPRPPTERLFLS
jgi:hypothetical protein